MKVLHVVHNVDGYSGASIQALNLANNIKDIGISQALFCTSKVIVYSSSDFKVYSPYMPIFKLLSFIVCLIKERPRIVHFHGADFLLLLTAKIFLRKVYWKTTLLGGDDFDALTSIGGIKSRLKRRLFQLIDINNALTDVIASINRKYLPEHKVIVVPNGVYIPRAVGFKKERLAIIVAAIIQRKKIIECINVYEEELMKHGYRLEIIGPCDEGLDGFEQSYVEDVQARLNDNVVYLGKMGVEELREKYERASVLIHLSEKEGFPNVVLEAMAYGLFVIASDLDGLSDKLFLDEYAGVNYAVGDVINGSLLALIEQRLNNGTYVANIINNYSFKVVAEKTCEVYKLMD